MKTINISRNSWHWKLTSSMWNEYWLKNDDFCTYVRKFLVTCLTALFLVTLGFIVGFGLIYFEASFFAWLYRAVILHDYRVPASGFLSLAPVGMLLNGISFFIGIAMLFVNGKIPISWMYSWIFRISCEKIPMCPETRDFVSSAYESIHDKVCFKLNVK